MSSATPKPGPHLSPATTSYRELAKYHADQAHRLLTTGPATLPTTTAAAMSAAVQAHALTSLAYTQLAPPARFRSRCNHPRPSSAGNERGEQAEPYPQLRRAPWPERRDEA